MESPSISAFSEAQAAVALLIADGTFGDRKPQVSQSAVQGTGVGGWDILGYLGLPSGKLT